MWTPPIEVFYVAVWLISTADVTVRPTYGLTIGRMRRDGSKTSAGRAP